jgi:tetratricopeptide (TPR) repeat protein
MTQSSHPGIAAAARRGQAVPSSRPRPASAWSRSPCIFAIAALAIATLTMPAHADRVVTQRPDQEYTGQIVRVDPDGIVIALQAGQVKLPMANIVLVEIDKPAAFGEGIAALQARKFPEAIQKLRPILERYGGGRLPWVPWVQEAMVRLGDAYLGARDIAGARRVFEAVKRVYPDTVGLEVKEARIHLMQKDCQKAMPILERFLEVALTAEVLTDVAELALAEALVLRGDCQRQASQPQEALDSYLLVVTLFDADPGFAAEAKYKAAQLFEQLGNARRARSAYEEILKEAPQSEFAADAEKQLARLGKNLK